MSSPLYLITCTHKTGAYVPERAVADMGRDETISDIATGQVENVISVVEVGTGRDVTLEIARAVMQVWADLDEPLSYSQREFLEQTVGINAANSFREVA